MVVFNNTASKPPKCHRSQLAKATTTNKEMLREFASSWTFGGKSNYSVGIEEAFSYFNINETNSVGSSRGKSFIKKKIKYLKLCKSLPEIKHTVSNFVSLNDRFNFNSPQMFVLTFWM